MWRLLVTLLQATPIQSVNGVNKCSRKNWIIQRMWPKKSEYSLKSEHWPTIVINYADINTFNVLSKKLSLQTLLPPYYLLSTIYYVSTCCGVNWNSIQPWSRRGDSGLYLTFNLVTHFNPVHFTYWQSVLPQPSTINTA